MDWGQWKVYVANLAEVNDEQLKIHDYSVPSHIISERTENV